MPRRFLNAFLAVFVLAFLATVSGSETVQVTMYYPPPVGIYGKVAVKDFIRIGLKSTGAAMFIGDTAKTGVGASAGFGGYGIYVRSSNMEVNAHSATLCGTARKSQIWLLPRNGQVYLDGATALGNVCTWVATVTDPQSASYGGAAGHNNPWMLMAVGTSASKAVGSGGADGLWCRMSPSYYP